jgi:ferritin-like protein
MSSEGYHEPVELLSEETRDLHRAIVSLIEELEAVDWYHQRVETCSDSVLRAVLAHNRDEELEHAMMALEWIRRRFPDLDVQARKYLFTTGEIAAAEASETNEGSSQSGSRIGEDSSLGIRSLRDERAPARE